MKKILFIAAAAVLIFAFFQKQGTTVSGFWSQTRSADSILQKAFDEKRSNFQVAGEGVVAKLLPDDRKGVRHQRFIIRLSSGQTVLVAHNIDLAPRIDRLQTGDKVAFYGEYEWNAKGGVVHWTHHDPDGRHIGGWLKHDGKTYQ